MGYALCRRRLEEHFRQNSGRQRAELNLSIRRMKRSRRVAQYVVTNCFGRCLGTARPEIAAILFLADSQIHRDGLRPSSRSRQFRQVNCRWQPALFEPWGTSCPAELTMLIPLRRRIRGMSAYHPAPEQNGWWARARWLSWGIDFPAVCMQVAYIRVLGTQGQPLLSQSRVGGRSPTFSW